MTYEEIKEALSLFGLKERATRREIKTRHRQLVKKYHPDSGAASDNNRIRNINEAYGILMEYIDSYRYSFEEKDFYDQNPDERLRRQFMNDSVWGGCYGEGE